MLCNTFFFNFEKTSHTGNKLPNFLMLILDDFLKANGIALEDIMFDISRRICNVLKLVKNQSFLLGVLLKFVFSQFLAD